jgi:hypothetical protein
VRRSVRISLFAPLLLPAAAWATTTVACLEGCRPATACEGNAGAFLLCLPDRQSNLKLEWTVSDAPGPDEQLRVYAGNPVRAEQIPVRAVTFTPAGGGVTGSFTFSPEDVGGGPFLVVTTLVKGSSEKLLSWIPYRTSTPTETIHELEGPEPGSNWSIDVAPAFLQVSAGWRELPRTRDARTRTWFSLAQDSSLREDADLDGEMAGVAGLSIKPATPWAARENWKSRIEELIGDPDGHDVQFESLHWQESPDRVIENIPGTGPIVLRSYYTVITLFTSASIANYTARDMGRSGSDRYFAHETSANLKQIDHPLLWASYSRNDYGADRRLLDLLREHYAQGRDSLELGSVQRVNGDGGPAVYRAAFTVRVQPWAEEGTNVANPQAGVVGFDVLAVRTGMGGIRVPKTSERGVQKTLCQAWGCKEEAGLKSIDFNKPPKGWEVSAPQASTLSISGQVPIMDGVKSIASRDPNRPHVTTLPKFPAKAQFALAASLRPGALVKRGGLFGRRVDEMVPINSYAQYVVRMTVAMFPGQQLVANTSAIVASPSELDVVTVTVPKRTFGQWFKDILRENAAFVVVLMCAAFVALLLLVPGFRSLVSAVFGLFASIIRRLTSAIQPKAPAGGG